MSDPLLDEDLTEKEAPPIRLFSTPLMVVGSALLFLGLTFKIQHWPLHAIMILTGCGIASGSAAYRALALSNTPVERAMRLFVPILTICILFYWLQYTLIGFGFFCIAATISAGLDHSKIKSR